MRASLPTVLLLLLAQALQGREVIVTGEFYFAVQPPPGVQCLVHVYKGKLPFDERKDHLISDTANSSGPRAFTVKFELDKGEANYCLRYELLDATGGAVNEKTMTIGTNPDQRGVPMDSVSPMKIDVKKIVVRKPNDASVQLRNDAEKGKIVDAKRAVLQLERATAIAETPSVKIINYLDYANLLAFQLKDSSKSVAVLETAADTTGLDNVPKELLHRYFRERYDRVEESFVAQGAKRDKDGSFKTFLDANLQANNTWQKLFADANRYLFTEKFSAAGNSPLQQDALLRRAIGVKYDPKLVIAAAVTPVAVSGNELEVDRRVVLKCVAERELESDFYEKVLWSLGITPPAVENPSENRDRLMMLIRTTKSKAELNEIRARCEESSRLPE